ncbi:MAG: FG-GAP repeat protein, partial [Planctomycetota bacterium]
MAKQTNLKTWLIVLVFLPGTVWSTSVFAKCELAKLLASDGASLDYFGTSVAISGETAVIGAYGDSDNGILAGSAYVFRFDGSDWVQEDKLTASDGTNLDYFGWSVAASGDTVVIGAYGDDPSETGAAYVFRFDGSNWSQEQKLTASDGADDDYFGYSVAISGDTAVIGAYRDDPNGGSAYVFRFDGSSWVQETKLTASDGAAGDWFGYSVAISGNTALIGAFGDDPNGLGSGSAYIFRFDGSSWSQEAKLVAFDGAENDYFGRAVAISGAAALIGAYGDDASGDESGSAYIFRYNGSTWNLDTKIGASDGAANDEFGRSVAISADVAVIGAHKDDPSGQDSGSAYVFGFDGSTWSQNTKLLASDGQTLDYFAYLAVAVSGDTTLVGAYAEDSNGPDAGSAYIFASTSKTWQEKLLTSDSADHDYFGSSADIWGDRAIIGATGDDDNGTNSGSAYIFRFDGSSWVEEAKLLPSDSTAYEWLGNPVAISGDTAVVGLYRDDPKGSESGSAYIFTPDDIDPNNWIQQAKLTASDGQEDDYFGYSVDVFGDTIVIGAPGPIGSASDANGSAYIFRYDGSTWIQEAKLTASDGEDNDRFGKSVAIWGDTAIMGAYGADPNGMISAGAAYVFRFDGSTWVEEAKL